MPRQPLVDTPGLPPYGQRSSERRKEQNRLAQRQLRERRQQQEAAQALKLQQQQNEIRRLHRLINELRSENFNLKNQGVSRRRQSVIPISSLSKGLMMNHIMPSTVSGGTGVDSCSKPLFSRHSIDYSSLQGACISTSSDVSHRPREHTVLQGSGSQDVHAMSYSSNSRGSAAKSNILQPTRLPYDNQFCRRTVAPQSCTLQDRSIKATCDQEKTQSNESYGGEGSSPMASSVSSRQPSANSNWLSASRNTTPKGVEVSEKPWVTSPQKLGSSPERRATSKGESGFLTLPSVNLASFWPAPPPSPPNNLRNFADVESFSDAPCNMPVVPAEFFAASHAYFSNNRIQPRKTSASADSDTGSSTRSSVLPASDSYSPLSTVNENSVHFSFASQEGLSQYITRSLSPTATGSSPKVKLEEKNFNEMNSTICFRSPFSETIKLETNEHSTLSLPFSWNDTKKYNVETLSPFPTHANSICSIDASDIWASDY